MRLFFAKKSMGLGLAAALALAACGGQGGGSPASSGVAPASGGAPAADSGSLKKVAITAIVEHPALDAVRKGAIEELAAQGFQDGVNVKINFQSAQGNTATAGQIAKQFVGDNPDVIVAIATPSAQAAAAATDKIPVVFAAVTDPVAAKLVPSMEASNTNVTGVSDMLPLEPQIDLIKKIVPNVKNIGYVYSPGEVNSTVVMKQLEEKLKPQGMNLVAMPAQKTSDIPQAVRSLKGKADVIYTSLDNNVVSAYESMFQAAKEAKLPLVAADTDSVKRGAVAALGVNYHDLGRETGKIVVRILKGEKAGSIKPVVMKDLDLYVSPKNAEAEGLKLSEDLIKSAKTNVDSAK